MADEQAGIPVPLNKGLLITGASLIAASGLLAALGIGCTTVAVVAAARAWSRGLPTPPNEIARQKLRQARHAGGAAAQAWRSGAISG